jgi:hypothetical protein
MAEPGSFHPIRTAVLDTMQENNCIKLQQMSN